MAMQVETPELKSAVLEAVASALFYNAPLTLQWAEASNATQVNGNGSLCASEAMVIWLADGGCRPMQVVRQAALL